MWNFDKKKMFLMLFIDTPPLISCNYKWLSISEISYFKCVYINEINHTVGDIPRLNFSFRTEFLTTQGVNF